MKKAKEMYSGKMLKTEKAEKKRKSKCNSELRKYELQSSWI